MAAVAPCRDGIVIDTVKEIDEEVGPIGRVR